jgi:hypothetical protein
MSFDNSNNSENNDGNDIQSVIGKFGLSLELANTLLSNPNALSEFSDLVKTETITNEDNDPNIPIVNNVVNAIYAVTGMFKVDAETLTEDK